MVVKNSIRYAFVAVFGLAVLTGCGQKVVPVVAAVVPASPMEAVASIQEIMHSIVDPAADGVWDVVGTVLTPKGIEERQPHTDGEWEETRRHALTLVEATNLLMMDGRRMVVAGGKMTDEGFEGVLNAQQAQEKLQSQHATFVQFAAALHSVAKEMLTAVDAHDPKAMMEVGGKMDEVCEACHTTFWYPTQPAYRVTTDLK